MEQLSFYSAEASTPKLADLAGLLCGQARIRLFARGTARLTVPVSGQGRAKALVTALGVRGVPVSRHVCEYTGEHELRTAFRSDLAPIALAWGPRKHVPPDFTPDGNTLRLWVLVAGRWTEGGYLLGLDPLAPHTRDRLIEALGRCGLPASPHSGGLRIRGRRRLARLVELVGRSPGLGCDGQWPTGTGMRVVS